MILLIDVPLDCAGIANILELHASIGGVVYLGKNTTCQNKYMKKSLYLSPLCLLQIALFCMWVERCQLIEK